VLYWRLGSVSIPCFSGNTNCQVTEDTENPCPGARSSYWTLSAVASWRARTASVSSCFLKPLWPAGPDQPWSIVASTLRSSQGGPERGWVGQLLLFKSLDWTHSFCKAREKAHAFPCRCHPCFNVCDGWHISDIAATADNSLLWIASLHCRRLQDGRFEPCSQTGKVLLSCMTHIDSCRRILSG